MFGSGILGISTGTLLGLLGGGGSVVAVPILVFIFGMDTKSAIATSLLIVGVSSFIAAFTYHLNHHVRVRTALLFAAAGCIGSFAGAEIGKHISDALQLTLFACVMTVVSAFMLAPKRAMEAEHHHVASAGQMRAVLAAGAGAGVLTGLLGVGGGFIIVPALALLLRLPMKQAIGTSLLIIALNSTAGAITYGQFIRLSGPVLPFAAGTIAAAPLAGHFSKHIQQEKLKLAFAFSLIALSIWIIAQQFAHLGR